MHLERTKYQERLQLHIKFLSNTYSSLIWKLGISLMLSPIIGETKNGTFPSVLLDQPKLYRMKNLLFTYSFVQNAVNCQKHLTSCWNVLYLLCLSLDICHCEKERTSKAVESYPDTTSTFTRKLAHTKTRKKKRKKKCFQL